MSASTIAHYQRLRDMQHAQGLLELVSCCDDRWGLDRKLKRETARKALRLLKKCRPRGRRLSIWYSLRGRAFLMLGKARLATRAYRMAIRADGGYVPAYLALAWCYKRSGRIDQSIIALSRACDRTPDHPIVRYNLACYLSLAGQPEQASLELGIALELKPELREKVEAEKDFDPIRHHPAFDAVTQVIV